MSLLPPLLGCIVAALASASIVATAPRHARYTADRGTGPQKLHRPPIPPPRIASLALAAGVGAALAVSAQPAHALLLAAGCAAALSMFAGLPEDLGRTLAPRLRLSITLAAGALFCALSGLSIQRIDLHVIDIVLAHPLAALGLTAFAIAGIAHAVNIVDGLHGLACGTTLAMLAAIGVIAHSAGDRALADATLAIAGAVAGVATFNFPSGRLLLGDAGAYCAGTLVGALAVALPMRNPALSPWISLLVLAYPVTETTASALRRLCARRSPVAPDTHHLHTCIHAHMVARAPVHANSLSGALALVLPLATCIGAIAIPPERAPAQIALVAFVVLYSALYLTVRRSPHNEHPHPRGSAP